MNRKRLAIFDKALVHLRKEWPNAKQNEECGLTGWFRSLEFLRDIECRRLQGQRRELSEDEKEELLRLSGPGKSIGPFDGLAMRDIADPALAELLHSVQRETEHLKWELLGRRS